MDISEETKGSVIVLGPKGRVDSNSAKEFEEKLLGLLNGGAKSLVIDLEGLGYISSAGLRVLLGARKTLTEAGSECLLVNMKPQIERVLEVIKALPGMRIFASAQEADDYIARIQEKIIEGE